MGHPATSDGSHHPFRLGFTGTRHGLAPRQHDALWRLLTTICQDTRYEWVRANHGGCVGADREFHAAVRELWGDRPSSFILIRPAAGMPPHLCDWSDADEEMEPLPPRERNTAIVRGALGGLLIACPAAPEHAPESTRSGTWMTCRIARREQVRRAVILPDGTVTDDGS